MADWSNMFSQVRQQIGTAVVAAQPATPVGYWQLGGNPYYTRFAFYGERPTQEHIDNHMKLLGWKWIDHEA